MADVTEVIHRITYEVNNDALNNATVAIQNQIAELNKLSLALDNYSRQMGKLSGVEAKEFDVIARKIDEVSKRIDTIAAKSKGALSEVFSGITKGITGNDGLKDTVAKYVTNVIAEFNKLKKAGEHVGIGFASHMTKMADSGQQTSSKLSATFGNLGKSLTSATGLIDLGVIALGLLGEELLKEGGIIDDFINKEKAVVTETDRIIRSFTDMSATVAEVAADEVVNTRVLYETATDLNQTYGNRIAAVKELQERYPEYFGSLNQEAILAGNAADKYVQLTDAIMAKAQISVYEDELKALFKQQQVLEKNAELAQGMNKAFGTPLDKAIRQGASPSIRMKLDINQKKQQEATNAELKKNTDAQEEISKRISDIRKTIKPGKIVDEIGSSGSSSGRTYRLTADEKKKQEQSLFIEASKVQALPVETAPLDKKTVDLPEIWQKQKGLTEAQKENIKEGIDGYQKLAQAAVEAYDKIIQAQIEALDKEISLREKRVEEAKKLAERGNVEALRLEEERLRKAQEQRARFARQQQIVNSAITVSNAIAAVARAALEGGGFGSAATIAALIAALAAGYAAVTSLGSNADSFADGVVGYKGKGGPRDDKNWVRISSGESIITAEGTQKNRTLLEAINQGAALHMIDPSLPLMIPTFKQAGITNNNYAAAKDLKQLENKLDEVVGAIEDNKLRQNIFFNEQGVGIMTERAIKKERKRWM